jgi:NAD(P)-dependent dehydrogenase (short-subunit alcohol dehydrogenase family)
LALTKQKKVAIVTGSSRGIGFRTALTLAENGFNTYATVRNIDKAAGITEHAKGSNLPIEVVQLDVTDDISVKQAIQFIVEKERQIDLLVNNAAFTMLGAAEDLSSEEIQAQFNTNVFVFRTISEVTPIMRRQKAGGTIINIGSANGFFGVPCASAYVATKFVLEGLTQSLRYELAHFGIKISIIEPGAIKTEVVSHSMYLPKKLVIQQEQQLQFERSTNNINSPFAEMTKSIMDKSKAAIANGSDPKIVAETVLKIAKTEKPDWRYCAGADAERLFEAKRQMSDTEFERFLDELFGT